MWSEIGCGSRDPDYVDLKNGRTQQKLCAQELHQKAGVPEGPCGIPELNKFQQILTGYQIKVMSVDKPHMIAFAGPEAPKKILLVKVDDHHHGCNLFSGFIERSYYCHDCERGYSNDDYKHHTCKKIWCKGCKKKSCPDWEEAKKTLVPGQWPIPTHQCSECNRYFYGERCYSDHKSDNSKELSICQMIKKCLSCKCEYEAAPHKKKESANHPKWRHRCRWAECPFCLQQVDQATHQCYIQPVDPDDDEPKLKKVKASEVAERQVVGIDDMTMVHAG